MNTNFKQRVGVKYCISNEISCANSHKMLKKCYDDSTLSQVEVYNDDRKEAEDLPSSGRSSTLTSNGNLEKVKKKSYLKIATQV